MALIIEDGSNVPNADSYVDLADVRAYVAKRGVAVSADDTVLEQHLILATDYVTGREAEFQGCRTNTDQSLTFPRQEVTVNGVLVAEYEIPSLLKYAIYELCVIQNAGQSLYSNQSPYEFPLGPVVEDTVGPMKTKYSDKHVDDLIGSPSSRAEGIFPTVEVHLLPLLKDNYSSGIGGLKVLRV